MKAGTDNTKIIILIMGLLLIGLSLFVNDRVLVRLFPNYGVATPIGLQVGIVVVDVLFAMAMGFILLRNMPRARIFADVLVGIGFTLLLWAGIEVAFYYLNLQNQRQLGLVTLEFMAAGGTPDVQFAGEHDQALYKRDTWLGYIPVPNTQVTAGRAKKGKTLYRVLYSIDSHSRRVTPVESSSPNPNHILFFGGSFTFGVGVNDDETMPYFVSKLAPGYRAYNYGVSGYGPQQMLANLQREEITAEIQESQGQLVYVFINEHILRAAGYMRVHAQRGEFMPYYYIDADGELARNGNLVSGRPVLSGLYNVLGRSQVLKFFNINFPLTLSEDDLRTTAKIIEESRNLYREKFNSDQFYVLIYPTRGVPELLPYLEAAGITYLDYSNLLDVHNDEYWLGEGHPTAKAHQIVAEKLVQDLGLQETVEK